MESVVVNSIIGFWLVLFGVMALFPILIESKPSRHTPLDLVDDQIISIVPCADVPVTRRSPAPLISIPGQGPDHREAA